MYLRHCEGSGATRKCACRRVGTGQDMRPFPGLCVSSFYDHGRRTFANCSIRAHGADLHVARVPGCCPHTGSGRTMHGGGFEEDG